MRDPDRLAALTLRNPHGQAIGMSFPNFLDLRERTRSFETLPAFNLAELNVIANGRLELASAHQVLGDFFELLGIDAELGRGLRPEDDVPGAEPVVVLSHDCWTSRFAGDPEIVGVYGEYRRRELPSRTTSQSDSSVGRSSKRLRMR